MAKFKGQCSTMSIMRALDKMKDGEGDEKYNGQRIYQWLEGIRVMGYRQSFMD